MARIESSILVSSSVGDIFTFLSVPENHAKFIPNMVEFNKTSPGPFGQVGATALGVLRILGQRMRVQYEIIEYEKDARLAMKGAMGPITFRDGYMLKDAENGARIYFWLELTMTGPAGLIRPLAGLIGRLHANETLANLRRALEPEK